MSEENKGTERVSFSRGYDVCIMAIDGTWRRDCVLNAISDNDAALTVEGSIQGLNLKEFFLLLSSTGLAYRRCELVRVNGTEMDVSFLKGKNGKKRSGGASSADMMMSLEPALASKRGGIGFAHAIKSRTTMPTSRPASGNGQLIGGQPVGAIRPQRARRMVPAGIAHTGFPRHRFPEKMQGDAEAGIASLQRRAGFQVAWCDIVQHDDIRGHLLKGGRGLLRDGRFDQRQARLNALDQGREVRDNRVINIIPVVGLRRHAAACSILHDCSPKSCF